MKAKNKTYRPKGEDFCISLEKLTGKKIKDVWGFIGNALGEPSFCLCSIVYEDGSHSICEGEHDYPYLGDDPCSEKIMEELANDRD